MSCGVTDCAAMDSSSTGSGAAHNNMMPYLALNFIICARK
jgi:microcystin-dependent protein